MEVTFKTLTVIGRLFSSKVFAYIGMKTTVPAQNAMMICR
ncbi:MAG: hypothetical protein ACI808_000040 [Paraglaciecola sp.]|jgi:hypothetical protein